MSFLSALDEPIADFELGRLEIKPWHLLVGALGIGVVIYFIFIRKGESVVAAVSPEEPEPAPGPTPPPTAAPAPACIKLGVQSEPIFEEHPLAAKVKEARARGLKIWRVPTGRMITIGARQQIKEAVIWACPPGVEPPSPEERLSPSEAIKRAEALEAQARKLQIAWGKRSLHPKARKLLEQARKLRKSAGQVVTA